MNPHSWGMTRVEKGESHQSCWCEMEGSSDLLVEEVRLLYVDWVPGSQHALDYQQAEGKHQECESSLTEPKL